MTNQPDTNPDPIARRLFDYLQRVPDHIWAFFDDGKYSYFTDLDLALDCFQAYLLDILDRYSQINFEQELSIRNGQRTTRWIHLQNQQNLNDLTQTLQDQGYIDFQIQDPDNGQWTQKHISLHKLQANRPYEPLPDLPTYIRGLTLRY